MFKAVPAPDKIKLTVNKTQKRLIHLKDIMIFLVAYG